MSKSEKRQRSEVLLGIRCYPEEKAQIQEAAQAAGISVGDLLRRCALGRKIVARTDLQLVSELSRLGGLQKHLYTQMKAQMTPELSREFALTLNDIRKALVGIDTVSDERLRDSLSS